MIARIHVERPTLRPMCVIVLGLMIVTHSHAADDDTPIRVGEYPGLWAGHKVTYSVQLVHDNGTFDGVAEHTEGRFKGIKFGFSGKLGRDQSLVMTRPVAGDTQVARAGPMKTAGGRWEWIAETRGYGIPEEGSWPFVLSIPERK